MLEYSLEVSRGYVRLIRSGSRPARSQIPRSFVRRDGLWVERDPAEDADELADAVESAQADDEWVDPDELDPDLEDEQDRILHPGRGDAGMSARSRMNMRRLFVSLPWELVGPRPALISLTYPGVWQPWVPDGRVWEAHRRAFERRWVRRWREPLVGVWVKEFQTSGRPHLHLYVGLPTTMADEDFDGLRDRTLLRHRLERRHGSWKGRNLTPVLGAGYGGAFGTWLLEAWADIVGTSADPADDWRMANLGGAKAHRDHGVDVAVMFWSETAERTTDRTVVAQYLAREAGKWRQKQPPAEFEKVGRYYGTWGRGVGFRPESTSVPLDPGVAAEVEARLARWVTWKLAAQRRGLPPANAFAARRTGDGVTAFGLGPDQATRILRWSQQAATRKRSRGQHRRGAGGAASGDLLDLLASVDPPDGQQPDGDQAEDAGRA